MGGPLVPADVFRGAFENAAHAMLLCDSHGRILAANDAAGELFGMTLGDLIGRDAPDMSIAEDPSQSETFWKHLLGGRDVEADFDIVTREGRKCSIHVRGRSNISPGIHLASVGDITRRKENELSRRRYELLREHAQDVLLFIDSHDGRILEANRAAERCYGYSATELTRLRIHDLRLDTSEEFDEQFRAAGAKPVMFQTLHRRKDGTAFPVEVSSRPTSLGDEHVVLSVIRDVTERRALQAKLIESDRLSMVGMMAAGLAHEINNPLGYVRANHDVLARELPRIAATAQSATSRHPELTDVADGLAQCATMLGIAMEGLERVRTIVHDLRTFSRTVPHAGVLVDLHQVIDAALNIAQAELRDRARLKRQYGDPPPVRGSTSRLGQVILNLVVNAAQAIPRERVEGGLVRVTTSTGPDGWACVEIADDGIGIAPSMLERLFEPFQTTKDGEGTGLGLYITNTIVAAHGGTISVESNEGVGTTVRLTFPPYEPTLDRRGSARSLTPT